MSRRGDAEPETIIGAAAITLHGRSRQQRYTKNADWKYISECAALIRDYNQKGDDLSDTVREADERSQPGSKVYFLGNGDCYSHVDYNAHLEEAKVDSVMVARGALIKPVCTNSIQSKLFPAPYRCSDCDPSFRERRLFMLLRGVLLHGLCHQELMLIGTLRSGYLKRFNKANT